MSCVSSLSLAGSLVIVSMLPSHHSVILKIAHHVYTTPDRCWLANWRCHCWSYRRHGPGPPKHVLCHGKLVSPQSATILVTKTPIPDRNFAASIWPLLRFRWNHDILCASSCEICPHFIPDPSSQLFATAKDISIGPVAVMSLTVSQIITYIDQKHPKEWSSPQIAINLAFVCGFIVLGIGLLRLGKVVELIPIPAVAGFMTGSALNIAVGQLPGLMGITGFKFVLNFLVLKVHY
jgi:Sulfate permease family